MVKYFKDELADIFFEELLENERARKKQQKMMDTFMKTGKWLDDEGNKLDIGKMVSFEVIK